MTHATSRFQLQKSCLLRLRTHASLSNDAELMHGSVHGRVPQTHDISMPKGGCCAWLSLLNVSRCGIPRAPCDIMDIMWAPAEHRRRSVALRIVSVGALSAKGAITAAAVSTSCCVAPQATSRGATPQPRKLHERAWTSSSDSVCVYQRMHALQLVATRRPSAHACRARGMGEGLTEATAIELTMASTCSALYQCSHLLSMLHIDRSGDTCAPLADKRLPVQRAAWLPCIWCWCTPVEMRCHGSPSPGFHTAQVSRLL